MDIPAITLLTNHHQLHRVTHYLDAHHVLRITRVGRPRGSGIHVHVWAGRPNYRERHMIARYRRDGSARFPIDEFQNYPTPKKKGRRNGKSA